MSRRDDAVQLLTHYFETAFRRAGAAWHPDNAVEVTDIVDAIIEAARAPESAHTRRVADQQKKGRDQ